MPTTDNPLRFLHISDTHISMDKSYIKDYAQYTPLLGAEALIREIQSLPFKPDFILHTGDVAYDPVPDVYTGIKDLFSTLDIPIHYLVGNHDSAEDLQRTLLGRSEDEIQPYLYGELDYKNTQIVYLDSNGEHNPEHPSGFIPQEQLDWLDNICSSEDERPLVIAVHHNALPVYVPWLDNWMKIENGADFHEIVRQARDRLCGVFYGHIHQNIQALSDGVLYVSAGSSWCQFISYPDASNTMYIHDEHTLPSFNIVTVNDSASSIIRHSFEIS
ncbi:MAG: 3',5'-cyclic-AMP phosphodiesterase [Phototrophicaceae bacterium]